LAVQQNNHEAAFLLIKNGADIFAKDEEGLTPLEWAQREKSVDVSPLIAAELELNEMDEDTEPNILLKFPAKVPFPKK
jgi:ankyrin repeat protein